MKVLFITPPYHAGVVEVAGSWVPNYFVSLAGALRAAGHEPLIYDAMTKNVTHDDIARKIRQVKPDMVATSAITCTSPDALKLLQTAKGIDPDIVTVAGGVHSSFMYREMFSLSDALDYAVVGEGERTMVELCDALGDGTGPGSVNGLAFMRGDEAVVTPKRPFIEDLNNMPMAWDLLDWEDYTYFILPGSRLSAISTSRGCEKDCTFCSQQKFWERTWRARNPEDLMRELHELSEQHGVDVVLLTDDYPTPDRQRWEGFLDLVIERDLGMKILMETTAKDIIRDRDILHKYKQAGIIHIYVGTEATDQKTLDVIKKDLSIEESKEALALLREQSIITETSFILGFPWETEQSVQRTLQQAKEFNPDFAHFLAIAPWPYADMYKDLEPYIAVRDYKKYNLIDPVVKPTDMELKDIDRLIFNCYREFYMGKLTEMRTETDEFKKTYLLRSMKLMMTNSFIRKKMGMLGEMPQEIKDILQTAHDLGL